MRKLIPLFVFLVSCRSSDTIPGNQETSSTMENLYFDFDLKDDRIDLKSKLSRENLMKFEKETKCILPSSFKNWLLSFSDGAVFNIGNLVKIEPLFGEESISNFCLNPRKYGLPEKLVPFAIDGGGGGELWCFYKIENTKSNELPIVWVSLGSVKDKGYVYCNSTFDRFLNINILQLLATDNDLEEDEYEQKFKDLYRKYDPNINLNSSNYHSQAIEFSELENQISKL
jgi:hypothetical protein